MELNNNYFKVELKVQTEKVNHIEKDMFNTREEAESYFRTKEAKLSNYDKIASYYSLILAECDKANKHNIVHHYRSGP